MSTFSAEEHWYAYKIFHNKVNAIKARAVEAGWRCFTPVRLVEKPGDNGVCYAEEAVIPSLLFIRSDTDYMESIRRDPASHAGVYCQPGTSDPAPIPDREMEIFIFVTTTGCKNLETVDEKWLRGDRVRITGGLFKGAEGYISRIHGTRRFIVTVEGIAAVATTFIPRQFIERISQ